jgi:hypothetical protein
MTRMTNAENLGPAGVGALELSWPVLRGASGAPVTYNDNPYMPPEEKWGVLGVIVANASYHALPAQITSVLYDDNSLLEEVKYMLPQALAVNINHLRPMYERAMGLS